MTASLLAIPDTLYYNRFSGFHYFEETVMTRKKQSWDSIVTAYPDQWVILDDVSWDHGLVMEGVVIEACNDDTMDAVLTGYLRQGKDYAHVRTSESSRFVNTVGFIHE